MKLRKSILMSLVCVSLMVTACAAADAAPAAVPAVEPAPAEIALAPTTAPTAPVSQPAPTAPTPTTAPTQPAPAPTPTRDPRPVVVQPVLQASQAVSQTFGPEGGRLEAAASDGSQFSLTIPAGSLLEPETITMTPLSAIEELPFSGGLAAGVQLEPDGLWLVQLATLVITPTRSVPLDEQTFFAYLESGSDFHLYPPELTEAITLQLHHFSGYGVGQATTADRYTIIGRTAMDRLAQIEQETAELLRVERAMALVTGKGDPKFWDKFHGLIRQTFNEVLKPAVEIAKKADNLPQISEGVRLIIIWSRHAALAGSDEFINEQAYIHDAFEQLTIRAIEVVGRECKEQHKFEQLSTLIRLERTLQLNGMGQGVSAIDEISECLRFELRFHSVITEGGFGDPYGYHFELHSTVLLDADGDPTRGKLVGSGPLDYTKVQWIGSEGCSFNTGGAALTLNVRDGANGLVWPRSPEGGEVTLTFDPGNPAEQVTLTCPDVEPLVFNTNAWKYYFDKLHASEKVENSYRIKGPRLAGEVMARWVYHQTTSGPSGQAVIEDTTIEIIHRPLP